MKRLSTIGRGQSAKVDLYYDGNHKTLYAVKVMARDTQESFFVYRERCVREFNVSKKIHSDGKCRYVVEILELKTTRVKLVRQISLVMDFFPLLLSSWLALRPSLESKLIIFKQLVLGVCHLHNKGITHRDLKIDNLCLSSSGDLKIIDLGSCDTDIWTDSAERPSVGIYGTDPFISPEANTSIYYLGTKNDSWALGIIFFVLVNSRLQSAGPRTTAVNLDVKGSNVASQYINYPWKSTSDSDYQAYKLLQLELEQQIMAEQGDLLSEYQTIFTSAVLPAPKFIDSIGPTYASCKLVTNKLKSKLAHTEIGIPRLFREMPDVGAQGWKCLARLIPIDHRLRALLNEIALDKWIRDIDENSLAKDKIYKLIEAKTTGYLK